MTRALVAAVALTPLLALAQNEYLSFKMIADGAHPFVIYTDNRSATPAGLNYTTMENAAKAAWNTWNAVSCAAVKTEPAGGNSGIPNPTSTTDDYSVSPVWLLTADADYQEIFGSGYTLALTIPRAYNGVLETCDTFFDGVNIRWSTDTSPASNQYDFQTIMLHEAGHCLGLDHNFNDSIMNPHPAAAFVRRTLGVYDGQLLCARYPVDGTVGSACLAGDSCATSELKCITQPETGGVVQKLCSRGCSTGTNANCETPTTCQPSSAFAGFNGACLLPGNNVNHVGRACANAASCGSGNATCKPEIAGNNGVDFWIGGYCSQTCAAGDPDCPAASTCVNLDDGPQCLANCRIGQADCRADYACAPIDDIQTVGVCVPRCHGNTDCSNSTTVECRTCDGLCVNRQNPTGHIGDVCLEAATCGSGQSCRITARASLQKQCTLDCARGCGTCPAGTACSPVDTGEVLCLRTCTGVGTCPLGLRCADTNGGKVCLPACGSDLDCPVGDSCIGGECYSPVPADAGCHSSICQKPDAGRPIVVPPKDGGTGDGGSGGCGCSAVDLSSLWLALAAILFTRRTVRR